MQFLDPQQGDKLLGAFRVASGIRDAVVLVHAPVGCHWGINFIERLSLGKTNTAISALRERSVIFGGHENLEKSIEIIFKGRKKRYLILLAANVPSIIGDDWEGILDSVEPEISYIALDCGGYKGKMADGYEECLKELCRWIKDPEKKNELSVNIIGIQKDVPRGSESVLEIKRILSLLGIKVNSVFPPSSISEIWKASEACMNLVFGYGVELAKEMEERWQIPWLFFEGYPYGISGSERFIKKVSEAFEINKKKTAKVIEKEKKNLLDKLKPAHMYLPCIYNLSVLISGDLPQVYGMASFLTQEIGCKVRIANVTSAYSWNKEIDELKDVCDNVLFDSSFHELERMVKEVDVDFIIGNELDISISKRVGIPLVMFSFPSISRITITELPYMGFRGVLSLVEDLINNVANFLE